jgi:hypothetical protein
LVLHGRKHQGIVQFCGNGKIAVDISYRGALGSGIEHMRSGHVAIVAVDPAFEFFRKEILRLHRSHEQEATG